MNPPSSESADSTNIPAISRELQNINIESTEAATALDCTAQCEYSDDAAQSELIEMAESLYSCSLNQLLLEPNRIKGLKVQLVQQRQASAIANCASLIETSECLTDVHKQLNSLVEPCEEIMQSVGNYCDSITNFSEEAHVTCKRWKEASKILAKLPTITEILEVPSLIESAIKNGSYDEALKLHLFMKKLASSRYLNDIPILKQLSYQCENLIATLASKLLRDLRSNLQLPLCLKIVSQLRKLDLFSETEIRIKFLTARDAWFQSILTDVPLSPPLLHLSKLIESARINLFDIATQYQAVFTSPSVSTISVSRSPYTSDVSAMRILSSWLICKTEMIISHINKDLADALADDPNAPVDSVRDLILYFGQSMSRIGMEIRPRLINCLATRG